MDDKFKHTEESKFKYKTTLLSNGCNMQLNNVFALTEKIFCANLALKKQKYHGPEYDQITLHSGANDIRCQKAPLNIY